MRATNRTPFPLSSSLSEAREKLEEKVCRRRQCDVKGLRRIWKPLRLISGIEKGKEFESIFFARRRYTGRGPPALASLHVRNNRPRYKMVKVIKGKRVSFRKATKSRLHASLFPEKRGPRKRRCV